MVQLTSDCSERYNAKINTYKAFSDIKSFFELKVEKGIFSEIEVKHPYYIGCDNGKKIKYYANKWYRCNCCKYIWEFKYPDFPANGFVRRIEPDKYVLFPIKWDGLII